jgi:hypothetical protein
MVRSVVIRKAKRLLASPRITTQHGWELLQCRLLASLYGLPTVTMELDNLSSGNLPPPILDDMCMPPFVAPTDHDDFTPLMHTARSLAARIIVELCTEHGNTVANLCNLLPECTIYTVNALAASQSGAMVTYELSEQEIGRVYKQHGFGGRVVQILANTLSLDLGQYLGRETVDLAIVDACHDTDYVLNDFSKVQPYVRPGGRVLFHDTHPSMFGHLRGSYKACLLLRRRGFDVRQLEDTWWAVWQAPTSHNAYKERPVGRITQCDPRP